VDAVLPITSIADPVVTSATSLRSDSPAKIHDAAQQFEALLLAQMLRSERESGNGWLGSGGDSTSDSAIEFAEQQFATLLARQGGLGIASLISQGLKRGS